MAGDGDEKSSCLRNGSGAEDGGGNVGCSIFGEDFGDGGCSGWVDGSGVDEDLGCDGAA